MGISSKDFFLSYNILLKILTKVAFGFIVQHCFQIWNHGLPTPPNLIKFCYIYLSICLYLAYKETLTRII